MLKISINKLRQVPKLLFVVFSVLLLLNLFVIIFRHFTGHENIFGLYDLFNFDVESNIPTYFITLVLLLCSILLYFIYTSKKVVDPPQKKYWLFLSIIFLCLSIDEFSSIHELLTVPFRNIFGITQGWFFFAWLIPGIFISLLFVVYFFKFYWGLPPRYKILFGLSALLFLFGAIGMELIGGLFYTSAETPTLTYSLLATIEESFEMIGQIVFVYSLVDYIKSEITTVNYEIS